MNPDPEASIYITADHELQPADVFITANQWLFNGVAAIGIMSLAYLFLWLIAKIESAVSAISRSQRCCSSSTVAIASAVDYHDSNVHQPKKHKRRGQFASAVLSCEGFSRVILLLVRAIILVGAVILITYIFGTDLPTWVGIPTFLAILGLGLHGPLTEYFYSIWNAFSSTTLQGVMVTVETPFKKFSGRIKRMTAAHVILHEVDTDDILQVPHSMYSSAVKRITRGQGITISDLD